MSIATAPEPSRAATGCGPALPDQGVRSRRWTREEYYRAAELGLFRPDERLELLDGEILEKMSPHNPPHANSVLRTTRVVGAAFGPGSHARPQLPLILGPRSEPEPDVLVVIGTEDDYATRNPKAVDARLVIEISDTTLRLDRKRKQAAYARAGIAEYWLVNLPARQLEIYRDPAGTRYRSATVYGEHEIVTPLAAPHASIRVADLLPPVAT
jgi:Uma2 family endonuclease